MGDYRSDRLRAGRRYIKGILHEGEPSISSAPRDADLDCVLEDSYRRYSSTNDGGKFRIRQGLLQVCTVKRPETHRRW